MTTRISPSPVWQLVDENSTQDIIATMNSDGSVTIPQNNAPITTPSGSGCIPIISRVLLSSAQLLALKTTPMQLTQTPPTGFLIYVESITLRYLFLTAAYTLNAGTLKIFQGPVANAKAITADLSAILTQAANASNVGIPALATGILTDAQALAQPIFAGNDGAANYTVGAGSLEIVVTHALIPV